MGRQIQIILLSIALFGLAMYTAFEPKVVYEITVVFEEIPSVETESATVDVPIKPVSPRERELFNRAWALSDKAY